MIDWAASTPGAAGTRTGVILGFLKGGVAPDAAQARERFAASLRQIIPHAEQMSVAVLVEATNRYESSVANSLADTEQLLSGFGSGSAQMLPDTFHMNIEESDMLESLRAHRDRFSSLHLSDNNRFFPGFGAIDFGRLIGFLKSIGYQGRLAIEGNVRDSVESDLRASVELLTPFLEA
jgi:sugar phosphate isomerase/epimerase